MLPPAMALPFADYVLTLLDTVLILFAAV